MFKKTTPMLDNSDSPYIMPKEEGRSKTVVSASKIGSSVRITGELSGAEPLTFDGEIDGRIDFTGQMLVIGAEGIVKGEIHAGVVRVEGQVEGNISASEQIIVTSSGRVYGDMVAPRLSLEDGAKLKGSIDTHTMSQIKPEPVGVSSEDVAPAMTASREPSSGKTLGAYSDDELFESHVIHS